MQQPLIGSKPIPIFQVTRLWLDSSLTSFDRSIYTPHWNCWRRSSRYFLVCHWILGSFVLREGYTCHFLRDRWTFRPTSLIAVISSYSIWWESSRFVRTRGRRGIKPSFLPLIVHAWCRICLFCVCFLSFVDRPCPHLFWRPIRWAG